jgi:uncharacterized protein
MKLPLLLAASLLLPLSAHAASFDCKKAATSVERQICADPKLSAMDEQLGRLYRDALRTGPKPELLTAYQRDWLKDVRNKCTTVECLREAYHVRLDDFLSPGRPTPRQ